MNDKRAQFFVLAAVLCLLLLPAAPERFRTLTVAVAVVYVLLAVASALDARSRR